VAVGASILEFAADDPLAAPVITALYHAAPPATGDATLRYRVEREGAAWIGRAPGRPPFGPATLEDVFAFLEWRATEDLLAGDAVFLHAAGVQLGRRHTLLVGESGAGKSTLAAHLLVRGHLAWGDDLVRFAPERRRMMAVPRSWKLDAKVLDSIYLLALMSSEGTTGMLLAPDVVYVSPAAFRRSWQAPEGTVDSVVLLDRAWHEGPARVERISEGGAAVRVARMLIGAGAGRSEQEQTEIMVRVLEAMRDVTAWRVAGADPAAVAGALERELAA